MHLSHLARVAFLLSIIPMAAKWQQTFLHISVSINFYLARGKKKPAKRAFFTSIRLAENLDQGGAER